MCYLPNSKGGHAKHVETGQFTPPRTPSEEATDPQNQSLSMGEHRVTIKLSKIPGVASSKSMRATPSAWGSFGAAYPAVPPEARRRSNPPTTSSTQGRRGAFSFWRVRGIGSFPAHWVLCDGLENHLPPETRIVTRTVQHQLDRSDPPVDGVSRRPVDGAAERQQCQQGPECGHSKRQECNTILHALMHTESKCVQIQQELHGKHAIWCKARAAQGR